MLSKADPPDFQRAAHLVVNGGLPAVIGYANTGGREACRKGGARVSELRVRPVILGRDVVGVEADQRVVTLRRKGFRYFVGMDLPVLAHVVGLEEVRAAISSASLNGAGKFFPLLSARLKIPRHAFGVKKNRRGTESPPLQDMRQQTPFCAVGPLRRIERQELGRRGHDSRGRPGIRAIAQRRCLSY